MAILTRYILKEFIKIFLMTLAALTLVYLSIHFLEKIRTFTEHNAASVFVFRYFLYKLPKIISDVIPLSFLLATLFTIGKLSRNNEVVACMSTGISIFKLTLPLLSLATIASVALFYLNGTLIPKTSRVARTIQNEKIENKPPGLMLIQNKIWLKSNPRTLLSIQMAEPEKKLMSGVHLYYLGRNFSLEEEIEARSLQYEDGKWVLYSGVHKNFRPDGTIQIKTFDQQPVLLNKTPDEILRNTVDPIEMTDEKLQNYVDRLTEDGFNSNRYRTDLEGRRAFPFVNFIMVLLGIPFAIQHRRDAGIISRTTICLFIGLTYWIVFSTLISLGHTTILVPWIAGWGTNLLFLSIGMYRFLNIKS